MQDFTKVVRLGTLKPEWTQRAFSVYAAIKYEGGRLSICGVEGPLKSGDCLGSCGQIMLSLDVHDLTPAKGWTFEKLDRFKRVWKRWHLNDMRAGTPAQMSYLRIHPVEGTLNWFPEAKRSLESVGLNPDPTTGYMFGTDWLYEPVPEYTLFFLRYQIPATDQDPAWV